MIDHTGFALHHKGCDFCGSIHRRRIHGTGGGDCDSICLRCHTVACYRIDHRIPEILRKRRQRRAGCSFCQLDGRLEVIETCIGRHACYRDVPAVALCSGNGAGIAFPIDRQRERFDLRQLFLLCLDPVLLHRAIPGSDRKLDPVAQIQILFPVEDQRTRCAVGQRQCNAELCRICGRGNGDQNLDRSVFCLAAFDRGRVKRVLIVILDHSLRKIIFSVCRFHVFIQFDRHVIGLLRLSVFGLHRERLRRTGNKRYRKGRGDQSCAIGKPDHRRQILCRLRRREFYRNLIVLDFALLSVERKGQD